MQTVRLPLIEKESAFWDFLEILFEELRCESFFLKVSIIFIIYNDKYLYVYLNISVQTQIKVGQGAQRLSRQAAGRAEAKETPQRFIREFHLLRAKDPQPQSFAK